MNRKKHLGLLALSMFPVMFSVVSFFLNPLVNGYGYVDLWEYGLSFPQNTNPLYYIMELVHLSIAIGLSAWAAKAIDAQYPHSKKTLGLTEFNRGKYIRFSLFVLLCFMPVSFVMVAFYNAPIFVMQCGNGGGGDAIGCAPVTIFHPENLIMLLVILFSVSFWLTNALYRPKRK